MTMQPSEKAKPKKRKNAFREYSESLFVAIAIALLIRALVIYPFRIPTGSMEDSLLVGDFLLANKFVYGLRSPDWIGIPYTQLGFKVPFFRTPGFRKPQRGDVVIFKYPRDDKLNYIKRCVAVSGDTIFVDAKKTYINGKLSPMPPDHKFIRPMESPQYKERGIFPPGKGNRDFYGPVVVPSPGDTLHFNETNKEKWFERFQLMVYEGHQLALNYEGESIELTVENLDRWRSAISIYPSESFLLDGEPLKGHIYTVKHRHYFMMGDNRDNSLDSRYWGFLPERYIVGEGLIVYWSWDSHLPLYRLFNKIRWNRILKLIR
ncbi:signal peptidase I [bacterium]|nr:signal peptidase I [bacterium]